MREVAEHIAVPIHLHKLTAMGLGWFYGLQIALVVDTFNGTHFPLLFIQDQQHVFFLPSAGGFILFAINNWNFSGYGIIPV